MTPLVAAFAGRRFQIVKPGTPLDVAADCGRLGAVRMLLEHGANVDAEDTKTGLCSEHLSCVCAGRQRDHESAVRTWCRGRVVTVLYIA